jgi:hypothetical protein
VTPKRDAPRSGRAAAVALVTLLICAFGLPRVAGALGLSSSNTCVPVGGNSSVGGDSSVGGQSPPGECCTVGGESSVGGDSSVGGQSPPGECCPDSTVGGDSSVGGESPPVSCAATTLSISLTTDSESDAAAHADSRDGRHHHHHHHGSDTSVTAHAVLAGANSASATGTVTYTVSSDDHVVNNDTEPVVNGIVTDSKPVTLEPGVYSWQASYSGDAHNAPSESPTVIETISPHEHDRCDHHRH